MDRVNDEQATVVKLEAEVKRHFEEFMRTHCRVAPTAFVPNAVLQKAWFEYQRIRGILDMVDELARYAARGVASAFDMEDYEGIWFDANSHMMIGIELRSWPHRTSIGDVH